MNCLLSCKNNSGLQNCSCSHMALDTGSGVQTVPGGESSDESHAHITCTIEVSLLC